MLLVIKGCQRISAFLKLQKGPHRSLQPNILLLRIKSFSILYSLYVYFMLI